MLERAQQGWSESKRWWLWVLAIQAIAAIVATGSALVRPDHGAVAVALPILGMLIPVAVLYLRKRADGAFEAAEAWRRTYLLKDSLDHEPSPSEYLALALDAPTSGPNDQKRGTAPYYSSKLQPGFPRLMENLAESALHTTVGAEKMAGWCRAAVVVALVVCATAIVAALSLPLTLDGDDVEGASRLARAAPQVASVTSVVLALIVTGQLVELALSCGGLARAARAVMRRALAFREASPSEGAALSLLGMYEAALAGAGIPIFAVSDSEAIDKEWAEAQARGAPVEPSKPLPSR